MLARPTCDIHTASNLLYRHSRENTVRLPYLQAALLMTGIFWPLEREALSVETAGEMWLPRANAGTRSRQFFPPV